MIRRTLRFGGAVLRWVARGVVAFVIVSVVQVLCVRWVTPPATPTMVQRVVERAWRGEGLAWVEHRNVPLAAMGAVPRAMVASEDGRFWHHRGFDWEGICSAAKANRSGKSLRGGSTISQQVARNLFLVQNRSWTRKGLEVYYTVLLELLVPKQRILELYGNVAETGPHHFGVEAGAQHWFRQPAARLSADRAARLVYLLPYPRGRSPSGGSANSKAEWIAKNAVPFPGDPGFDRAAAAWQSAPGLASCW